VIDLQQRQVDMSRAVPHVAQVFPVIHHLDAATTLDQADLAFDAGADGIFLISHPGDDRALPELGAQVKTAYPKKRAGLNLLGTAVMLSAHIVARYDLDMLWIDHCGVSSAGITAVGKTLADFQACHAKVEVFGSVAFKYQAYEPSPASAAALALQCGFIPTTSGPATGKPPTERVIAAMSLATGRRLAVASGMTSENVAQFAPYLSHVLVATGVSTDGHHLDFKKLTQFIARVRISASTVVPNEEDL